MIMIAQISEVGTHGWILVNSGCFVKVKTRLISDGLYIGLEEKKITKYVKLQGSLGSPKDCRL